MYRAIYAENGKLPASAQCADILVYVFALSRDHEHGSAMSRQTATWRCRVRDTPRLRRRRVHATANPAGFIASPITNAAFAAHECPRIVSQNPLLYCRFGIRGKVHEQAHFHVRQPEIVHQLGTMLGRQFGNCLDLNYDFPVAKKVWNVGLLLAARIRAAPQGRIREPPQAAFVAWRAAKARRAGAET